MSVRLIIDPIDFVQNAGIRHGKILVIDLVRLHDLLFDKEGVLIYQISGRFDKNAKPGLQLEVKGKIHLNCQRCLEKLGHNIDLKTFLLLAKNEVELQQADEDDTVDTILATPDLDVINLIEDEVILGLSISSRHADGECNPLKLKSITGSLAGKKQSVNPFAVLATLKKTH